LIFLIAVVTNGLVIFYFYKSDLRATTEDSFFDLRTLIKPQNQPHPDIITIGIDDRAIETLNPTPSKKLSPEGLSKLVKRVMMDKPKGIALLLNNLEFNYDDASFLPIKELAISDERIFLGTFGLHRERPSVRSLSDFETSFSGKSYSADNLRMFHTENIRTLPIAAFRGDKQEESLIVKLASTFSNEETKESIKQFYEMEVAEYQKKVQERFYFEEYVSPPSVRLNYFPPLQINAIDAEDLLTATSKYSFENKIVLIGLTSYRLRQDFSHDGTYVNTPWSKSSGEVTRLNSSSYLSIFAIGLDNLLTGSWLRTAPISVNVTITIAISMICLSYWSFSISTAIFLYFTTVFLLIWLNSYLFSAWNLFIPIADSLFFSSLATILGSFHHARKANERRLLKLEKNIQTEKIAKLQSVFFQDFSTEITRINKSAIQSLRLSSNNPIHNRNSEIYKKAEESLFELHEYMNGLQKFASLEKTLDNKLDYQDVLISQLFDKMIVQFETKIKGSSLQITRDFQRDKINCDPILLEHILFNVFSNAVQHSPPQGFIHIATKIHKKSIAITVSDQGPGIPLDQQKKIFQKFYRVQNDDVHKIKGTGLGLFLAKFFAEKLGGSIRVDSLLGKGSHFTIIIPAKPEIF
jgi:signal transduction histidine kinase